MRELFPSAPEPWIDLSTGINPWPWLATGWDDAPYRLPTETDQKRCVAAMAKVFGAPGQNILIGPGSELLIHLLPMLLRPRRVAVLSPTYADHAHVWRTSGCHVIETPTPLAEARSCDMVVICNPNNPDGRRFDPAAIEVARRHLSEHSGWLVIDEAFADLTPELCSASCVVNGNLLVLRSAGKFYGLAGLRLGALLGPPELLRRLAAHLGLWRVSTPALTVGAAAYEDCAWQTATRQRLAKARERLDHLLAQTECRVMGGTDLFRYVEVTDADEVWRRLAEHGVYVRRFSWTNHHLRIGLPRDAEAEARLLDALRCSPSFGQFMGENKVGSAD